jgi:hypothetical protein
MGLMPAGNPFAKLDRQGVLGTFKANGSRDTDVLHSQKEQLLAQQKQFRLLGVILMVGGAFFTVTVILAIAGIPLFIFGWWLRRFGTKNIAAIEQGYADYMASAQPA